MKMTVLFLWLSKKTSLGTLEDAGAVIFIWCNDINYHGGHLRHIKSTCW